MASHLLTAIIIPLPRSWAIPAILASCSVTPSVASITRMAISHLSTAATVLIILYLSRSSFILLLRLRPAVSMNTYSFLLYVIVVSIASLVVPAILDTITLFFPRSLLIIDDLPTLGLPIMATFGRSSSSSVSDSCGKCLITSSSISPRPSFDAADIGCGSPIPRL